MFTQYDIPLRHLLRQIVYSDCRNRNINKIILTLVVDALHTQ
jgi:hypothetical protein